jgi:hypothetical protein
MGQPSVDAFDEVEVDADEAVEEAAPTRSRQSLKLHGHTQNVNCLAALADGRLARHPTFARDERGAEPFSLHIVTSVITGVVATTVAAPFDTIKSRVMARGGNAWTALRSLVAREGPALCGNQTVR